MIVASGHIDTAITVTIIGDGAKRDPSLGRGGRAETGRHHGREDLTGTGPHFARRDPTGIDPCQGKGPTETGRFLERGYPAETGLHRERGPIGTGPRHGKDPTKQDHRQDHSHQTEDDTGIEETAIDDSLTIPTFSTIVPSLHLCARLKQGGKRAINFESDPEPQPTAVGHLQHHQSDDGGSDVCVKGKK